METSKDFEEFFELLNKNEVRYTVVGGYAYSIHVEPRYTKDLDIFVEATHKNAEKVVKTLHQFGFTSSDLNESIFLKPEQIIQLGNAPLRIDLLTSIDGVSFEEVWKNKITAFYGTEKIYVIGKNELIKNKKSSNRPQDKVDVSKLEETDK